MTFRDSRQTFSVVLKIPKPSSALASNVETGFPGPSELLLSFMELGAKSNLFTKEDAAQRHGSFTQQLDQHRLNRFGQHGISPGGRVQVVSHQFGWNAAVGINELLANV